MRIVPCLASEGGYLCPVLMIMPCGQSELLVRSYFRHCYLLPGCAPRLDENKNMKCNGCVGGKHAYGDCMSFAGSVIRTSPMLQLFAGFLADYA